MNKRNNYSPAFKVRVVLEAIPEEPTLTESSNKYVVHPIQIEIWKHAAIENMATALTQRGSAPEQVSEAKFFWRRLAQVARGRMRKSLTYFNCDHAHSPHGLFPPDEVYAQHGT